MPMIDGNLEKIKIKCSFLKDDNILLVAFSFLPVVVKLIV